MRFSGVDCYPWKLSTNMVDMVVPLMLSVINDNAKELVLAQ